MLSGSASPSSATARSAALVRRVKSQGMFGGWVMASNPLLVLRSIRLPLVRLQPRYS